MNTRLVGAAALALVATGVMGCGAGPDGETIGSSGSDIKSCPSGTVEGVDVSYYQGDIDWAAVKASGRQFAFARVSDGDTYLDPQFDANWSGMQTAGLVRGVYQFFRPEQSATSQANIVISHVGSLEAGDLPPVLDVEVTNGASSATIVAGITTWVNRIHAALGVQPIVYTAPGFWEGISGTSGLTDTTLWVANWEVSCPTLPSPWSHFTFWQYSDTGSVPGISGDVDVDRFNGSLSALLSFAQGDSAGSTTPAPTAPAPTTPTPSGPANAGGCYSDTLGREMPANACVQSGSNSEWYQCDQGSWVDRWDDPTACNGVYPL